MSKQSSTLQIFPVHFQNIEAIRATAFWRTTIKVIAFHDTLLRTEKPPYRFPHTAAECLFAEQVAVYTDADQRQHQNIFRAKPEFKFSFKFIYVINWYYYTMNCSTNQVFFFAFTIHCTSAEEGKFLLYINIILNSWKYFLCVLQVIFSIYF